MDELQLLRRVLAEDSRPDEQLLTRVRAALDEEIASSETSPGFSSQRRTFRFPRRHRWPALAVAVTIAIALVVLQLLPTAAGYSDLGLEVSSASTLSLPATNHPYDAALTFGYLPPGLVRGETTLQNKTTNPRQFTLSVQLANHAARTASTEGFQLLDVSIEQGNIAMPLHKAASTSVRINGHLATMTVVPPQALPHGPPPLGCGIVAKVTLNALARVFLNWQIRPGVVLEMTGVGLSAGQVLKVARGIVFRASLDDCLAGTHIVSRTGACTPGSPGPNVLSMFARPNTEIGKGTLRGTSWNVSAAVESSYDWVYFQYDGALVSGQCVTAKDFAPELDVHTSITGERFATGWVPGSITSVSAASPGGRIVSAPVLPRKLAGASFFILYLGQNKSVCDQLCSGKVTLAFYRGSKRAATVAVSSDASVSGFPVPGRTTAPLPHQFRSR